MLSDLEISISVCVCVQRAAKRIPDLHPALKKAESTFQYASFMSLVYFKAFSKLFISPWCWREEMIMDAKQKVTHIQNLLPQVFALRPRRESLTCPCRLTNYLKNTEDNVCFQTVIPVIIYVQYDQNSITGWLLQILKNRYSLFNLARFIMMHWIPALTISNIFWKYHPVSVVFMLM